MSYDLFFYKEKKSPVTQLDISNYLTTHLVSPTENATQWFFENKDTEVYFSFDENEPDDDPESIELFDSFELFENTNFTFNLNFLRPDFFGIEALKFVEKFIAELDLFVLNPQSATDPDNPYKPASDELYQDWSTPNFTQSARLFEECQLNYLPLEKTNAIWNYNFNREGLQNKLGDEYFVPKIFFFQSKTDGQIITLASWTKNIPSVLPNVDYYLIVKKYKSFFKEVEEVGVISYHKLFEAFSEYTEEFGDANCKIIRPDQTSKTLKKFNNLKVNVNFRQSMERISVDKIVNNRP